MVSENGEGNESSDDFLLVTPLKLNSETSAQTDLSLTTELSENQAVLFHNILRADHEQHRQVIQLVGTLDKLWSTFLVFNVILLPCVIGLIFQQMNDSILRFSDVPVIHEGVIACLTICSVMLGIPVYVFLLAEMENSLESLKELIHMDENEPNAKKNSLIMLEEELDKVEQCLVELQNFTGKQSENPSVKDEGEVNDALFADSEQEECGSDVSETEQSHHQ